MHTDNNFKVYKKILNNGLTILVKPQHNIPRVESHIWYNVGAKNEELGAKGITHLIEHMLFKGTKNLSESDINLISHKLLGYANAFTSHDSTSYTFRMPSNAWEESLAIFAECMQNATFKEDVLASEIKAVIEEFGMYQEDYQNQLIENLIAAIWPEHPYHTPVLGTKYDLYSTSSKKLLSYYKKHYHPQNATLIIVGDVKASEVFEKTEKYFGKIKSPSDYKKQDNHFISDVCSKTVKLFRDVKIPWCCYAYQIPGFSAGQNYIFDSANLLLANGNNSRLHRRLVSQTQLAVEVGSLVYEFNENSLLLIFVYPQKANSIPEIETIITDEIKKLQSRNVTSWEFETAKKKILLDYASLLEDLEKQATLIGNFYMTTKDENYLEKYLDKIKSLTPKDIASVFKKYFDIHDQHKGYLLPVDKISAQKLHTIQEKNNALDQELLKKFDRKTPVEQGKWANNVKPCSMQKFEYPKPTTFTLPNGLDVTFYNNTQTPGISAILSFKANSNYDTPELSGLFVFLLRHLMDQTNKYSSEELHRALESNGVFITNANDVLTLKCLSENFEKALYFLQHILTNPSFDKKSIEKIKKQTINELTEYWDTPIEFIEQLAKEHIYQQHPYSKNPIGTLQSIDLISAKDLRDCYKKHITPAKANLVVVGDLRSINIESVIKRNIGCWTGSSASELIFPEFTPPKPKNINLPLKRDQVVLALTAPSISRKDKNFNTMAIIDVILTGGAGYSSSSRLFDLREKYGLFYAIGGSLLYNSKEEPGIMLIKTLISYDKVNLAKKLILSCIDDFGKNGVTIDEFENAKKMILSGNIEHFESNLKMAATLLFLKNFKMSANLFDKMGALFSIIKIGDVNKLVKVVGFL
ncbi:MAG: Processing peptidase [candidate division TM6 bacterium GW2011_GWF2_37_49]|nr:MAG: Processing peptidase [candidate division TM6 bacterium GW2011_GWF2_37_49]